MSIFDEDKIDCHNHVLDPARFPYSDAAIYRPTGSEIGTQVQHQATMTAYGIRHALLVGPNSGYGYDNRCLLDTIAASNGRFKGIAVVPNDTGKQKLLELKSKGIVGIAFNPTIHGVAHYEGANHLMRRLAELDMFVQIQVEGQQLLEVTPWLVESGARILIDHCGRPDLSMGIKQPGFQALLDLARSGRATVKLSGLQKFSHRGWPYSDALPFVEALLEAFTLDHCLWASDWPYLKASERVDIGPLLVWFERLLPNRQDRHRLFWQTPYRLFDFGAVAT
jgi:predicted TIM-barrel fold metal-dependent hydrolase